MKKLVIKIDVDTDIGTKKGVPILAAMLKDLNINATFLFSLGPDHTGRALKRIFNPGFLKKVFRTKVVSHYGLKTLLYGVLLPGPYIAKRHATLLRTVRDGGFEIGIHAYDHCKWQNGIHTMTKNEIQMEFQKACNTFIEVFGATAKVAGVPGWQANEKTLTVYDQTGILYASDCRGLYPFFPRINDHVFNVLQIPTTLPTLDEWLVEHPLEQFGEYIFMNLSDNYPNVITVHAELEGMDYAFWFRSLLTTLKSKDVVFVTLQEIANDVLKNKQNIPICDLINGSVANRAGMIAIQKI